MRVRVRVRVRGSVRALGVALELQTLAVVDDRQPDGLEQLTYNQVRVRVRVRVRVMARVMA